MTRITNAEQVLMLLRAHLERAQRSGKKRAGKREGKASALQRVQHLASVEGLSETDLARALIAGLLTEEFGAEFAADARFQGVVEDVRRMIDQDEAGQGLLRTALAQLTK